MGRMASGANDGRGEADATGRDAHRASGMEEIVASFSERQKNFDGIRLVQNVLRVLIFIY